MIVLGLIKYKNAYQKYHKKLTTIKTRKMKSQLKHLAVGLSLMLFIASCKSTKLATPESVGMRSAALIEASAKMKEFTDNKRFSGIHTRVIKDGKVIHDERYGFANIEANEEMKENSMYRIFSMTKPITATALMTLHDQGKLSLDDKVSKYIPEFANTMVYKKIDGKHGTEPQKNEVTLRHLLTHTSGIPYGWNWSYTDSVYARKQFMRKDWTIEEMAKDLATVPLKFQPGTKWNYGLGLDIVGRVVEVVSGQNLRDYFKSAILDPLKMNDTDFYTPEDKKDRMVKIYNYNKKEKKLKSGRDALATGIAKLPKLFLGGAGLVSTVDDYEKFARMLLNKGELNGVRILSEKAVKLMMTDHLEEGVDFGRKGVGHGLAGTVDLTSGEYSWSGAASTKFWVNPTDNLIVICYTQMMPTDHLYANEFKKIIDKGIIKE